jgi:hypothetical protein
VGPSNFALEWWVETVPGSSQLRRCSFFPLYRLGPHPATLLKTQKLGGHANQVSFSIFGQSFNLELPSVVSNSTVQSKNLEAPCDRLNNGSKDVHILYSGIHEYVK